MRPPCIHTDTAMESTKYVQTRFTPQKYNVRPSTSQLTWALELKWSRLNSSCFSHLSSLALADKKRI